MKQYLELLSHLLSPAANIRVDRTGTGTRSVFGHQMRFDLSMGFPLVTSKKVNLRAIIHELLWFLKGDTNIQYLKDNNVSIWDEWALQEDITERVPLQTHERAALYAEKTGRTTEETVGLLGRFKKEDVLEVLERAHIPKTKQLVLRRKGDLGPVYGKQWRSWHDGRGGTIDQIKQVIGEIKTNPYSRRLIVSAWNVADLPDMALQPCHVLFQLYVTDMTLTERIAFQNKKTAAYEAGVNDGSLTADVDFLYMSLEALPLYSRVPQGEVYTETHGHATLDEMGIPKLKLSSQLYQRSGDTFLGIPFNIASYALLTHMVAQVCGMAVGDFVWTGGDVHLYSNHVDQARLQLTREPLPLPALWLNPEIKDIDDFTFNDIRIDNYQSHPAIKAPIAV